jgi:hypothetical protein
VIERSGQLLSRCELVMEEAAARQGEAKAALHSAGGVTAVNKVLSNLQATMESARDLLFGEISAASVDFVAPVLPPGHI